MVEGLHQVTYLLLMPTGELLLFKLLMGLQGGVCVELSKSLETVSSPIESSSESSSSSSSSCPSSMSTPLLLNRFRVRFLEGEPPNVSSSSLWDWLACEE